MHDLPTGWGALCALAFSLGMRHGLDADHLAAIDGLTRVSARHQRAFSRYCGALFSLGHGFVVLLIAAVAGWASQRWTPPTWLDATGAWISIAFLFILGLVNLHAVLQAAPGVVVAPVGLKGRFVARFTQARTPMGVAAVGALFAVSFDTVSQSALFAVMAAQYGGLAHALTLGLLFMLGMLLTDGLNGWWIARLIRRTDQLAVIASRVMGVVVSVVSLLVAALGIGKVLLPSVEGWSEGKELALGALVVAVVAAGYLVACQLARTSVHRPIVR